MERRLPAWLQQRFAFGTLVDGKRYWIVEHAPAKGAAAGAAGAGAAEGGAGAGAAQHKRRRRRAGAAGNL